MRKIAFADINVNKQLKNILSNYTPHEIITCDDRDLPWINKTVNA